MLRSPGTIRRRDGEGRLRRRLPGQALREGRTAAEYGIHRDRQTKIARGAELLSAPLACCAPLPYRLSRFAAAPFAADVSMCARPHRKLHTEAPRGKPREDRAEASCALTRKPPCGKLRAEAPAESLAKHHAGSHVRKPPCRICRAGASCRKPASGQKKRLTLPRLSFIMTWLE